MKKLSGYNELTFEALIGNKVKTEKHILYKIAMTTAINDISTAEINEHKEPRGKDEFNFLNNTFLSIILFYRQSVKKQQKQTTSDIIIH